MENVLSLFPGANSVVVAAIDGLPFNFAEFQLSNYIKIVHRNDVIDAAYLGLAKISGKPEYYIVGVAEDERYRIFPLEITNAEDATASLTLAQLALSIFCKSPFILGTNICFTKYIASPVILTSPNMQGQNWELPDDMVRVPTSPFWCSETDPHMFIQDLKDFFLKVATAYYKKIDYRWNLAAFTFLSGINCKAAHEAILDFSTALEALLNTDKESISFKVRYYSALLLGENYSERLAIRKDIGEFYSLRSKIIHGKFTNISSKELAQIARTGGYIGNLLMKTCGRSIESDVFEELDYMSLLGAPKLSNTHSCIVITEEDIVDAFKEHKCIDGLLSYKFVLEKNVYDDNELTLYIETIDDEHLVIDPLQYIFYVPAMRGINSFSHWIKGNDDGKYEYVISK